MNNAPANLNSIRQPAPSVQSANGAPVERKYNTPNVGILEVPVISRTPLLDTMTIKRQENPRTIYKFTTNANKGFKLQNFFSLAIVGCSIGALLKLLKK
ncbi:MAG: hypothetical protein IJB79_06680 [Candidatus Gastranaerophilales bacterium]|nr:hypothetical protein [Candidatus Gastranaerophilales bacterium]